jgi:hypothetical protein
LENRSLLRRSSVFAAVCVVLLVLAGCGKTFFFAGRTLPPSGLKNRVLIAVSNPSAFTRGALVIVDAFYDIRHSFDNKVPGFSVSGFGGALPVTIQNMPEEQAGAVYSQGDGSFNLISYAAEKLGGAIAGLAGPSSSIFVTRDQRYVFAATQGSHVYTVIERLTGKNYYLNLPGIYRVSVNPAGTIALGFIQNSNNVYSVVHLTAAQQSEAAVSADPQHYQPSNALGPAQDCEPQNLPAYCLFQVSQGSVAFDHPVKALFSPDGTTAYVLNCGPECGGTTAGVTTIPISANALNPNGIGPSGIAFVAQNTYPVAGGVTNGIFSGGTTLYLAGQQWQPSAQLFEGFLSIMNPQTGQITGSFPISDGTHNRMLFADDSTLWIGSSLCQSGVRFAASQTSAGASTPFGCLTSFNISTNVATVDAYKGDATGIADVQGLHKVYSAEGGQVYIYNTTDMSERDNSQVTVAGDVSDVAYMDSTDDGDNTVY